MKENLQTLYRAHNRRSGRKHEPIRRLTNEQAAFGDKLLQSKILIIKSCQLDEQSSFSSIHVF